MWYKKNKEKRLEINKKYQQKVRLFVKNYKKERSCVDCGYSGKENPCVLDFDHLSDKKYSISRMNFSIEKVLEEIKKCELVCANCHRIRTEKRRSAL